MLVPAAFLGVAAIMFRPTLVGAGVCAVLALLLLAMGILHELTAVYGIERWS